MIQPDRTVRTHETPAELRDAWLALRSAEKGLHGLESADRLGVTELDLVDAVVGASGEVTSTRLRCDVPSLLSALPSVGCLKAVTRNRSAVIEVTGTYEGVEFFGAMGQSVGSIDLRVFPDRWAHVYHVREEGKRGALRSLQAFDAHGTALHKVFVREGTDIGRFDALVERHAVAGRTPLPATPVPAIEPERPDAAIDVERLRTAWRAMKDTHDFFGLLRRFGTSRVQALRLAGSDLALPITTTSLAHVLEGAAATQLPIMIFVGNQGVIQIHSGPVHNIVTRGPWINVLDPDHDLHVRNDAVASAWLVRKPTADGIVTSVELYGATGEQLALLFGTRKPGNPESQAWRSLAESCPRG